MSGTTTIWSAASVKWTALLSSPCTRSPPSTMATVTGTARTAVTFHRRPQPSISQNFARGGESSLIPRFLSNHS